MTMTDLANALKILRRAQPPTLSCIAVQSGNDSSINQIIHFDTVQLELFFQFYLLFVPNTKNKFKLSSSKVPLRRNKACEKKNKLWEFTIT